MFAGCMLAHIATFRKKIQPVNPRQIGDELLIAIRLRTTQLVVEMNEKRNNSQFAAQFH